MSSTEFEETIGTSQILDSNGSKLVWYVEKVTNRKLGKIIAKRLNTTTDKVAKNAKRYKILEADSTNTIIAKYVIN